MKLKKPRPVYRMQSVSIDMTGKTYNHWTVLRRGPDGRSGWRWECRCQCGAERLVYGFNLRSGQSKSCGICLRPPRQVKPPRPEPTPLTAKEQVRSTRVIFTGMKLRCSNPNDKRYADYGGRGITCAWETSDQFIADMGLRPSRRHSIDRIDNDGPYSPDNCRWATREEQGRNQHRNRSIIRSDGVVYPTIVEAAEAMRLNRHRLRVIAARNGNAAGYRWALGGTRG